MRYAEETGDPVLVGAAAWNIGQQATLRVGEGHNFLHTAFGPGNVGIHHVCVALEAGKFSAALCRADEMDTRNIALIGRRTCHLYQIAQCHSNARTTPLFLCI
jgi:hypothetical protein